METKTPLRLYLETTMFNFPFVTDAPALRDDTLAVWKHIKAGHFTPFTSDYTYKELEATVEKERRERMLALIWEYGVIPLKATPEVIRLALLYIEAGAMPKGFFMDARHIAVTTLNHLDAIVSLNFKHISREKTIAIVSAINAQEGYPAIHIYRPSEVLSL